MNKQGVIYFEVRYNPYDFHLSTEEIVNLIHIGLERGREDFGIIANQIICLSRDTTHALDTVILIDKNKDKIVEIDVAGDESIPFSTDIIMAYQKAKELGIHRTVHSENVADFHIIINDMKPERIGHGYYVIRNNNFLQTVKENNIHMECSVTPGSYGNGYPEIKVKAAHRFLQEGISFSLNTDDPSVKRDCTIINEFKNFYSLYPSTPIYDYWIKITTEAIKRSFADENTKLLLLERINNLSKF